MIKPRARATRATEAMLVVVLINCSILSTRAESKPQPAAILSMGDISKSAVAPARITIRVGDSVEWINAGNVMHMVRSLSGSPPFHSKYLQSGEKFEYKFTRPGTYRYSWMTHPQGRSLKGIIVVTPEPAAAGSQR
jgi:plastocyanin